MTIFLILAPYGAFAFLMLATSATVSLLASAVICLAVVALDVVRGRSIKLLGARRYCSPDWAATSLCSPPA